MVTKADVIFEAVKSQFGDLTGAVIETDDILRWINEGQLQILKQTSSLLGTPQSIPMVAGDNQYDLSADFFRATSVELDGRRLQFLTQAQMAAMYPSLNSAQPPTGNPRYFTTGSVGTGLAQLYLAPKPSQAGTLTITYKARPVPVNASTDNLSVPDENVETLQMYCIAKAKQMEGDDDAWAAHRAVVKDQLVEDGHEATNAKNDDTYPFIRVSNGDYEYGGWG